MADLEVPKRRALWHTLYLHVGIPSGPWKLLVEIRGELRSNYESFPSFRLSPALLICTKGVWGLGKPKSGQILPCLAGQTPRQEGFREVSSWASKTGVTRRLSRCGFGVPWRPFGAPDGRFLGTLEAVLGQAEAVRAPPLHEKMHVLVCTLLESFRPPPLAQVLCHTFRAVCAARMCFA